MRGSVYYQSAELCRTIFREGTKKTERIDPSHENYQKIASYKTMDSYRKVWENFFNYLREHWNLKDCEKIDGIHVAAYMDYKIEYYPSRQYLEKIVAAMGKLQIALEHYSREKYGEPKLYDFAVRLEILEVSKQLDLVADNYHNRAYDDPDAIISELTCPKHVIAAKIQLEGGARLEGVSLIKMAQLLGTRQDSVTGEERGIVFTKEKGGKEGEVLISTETYGLLQKVIIDVGVFKINRQIYSSEIRTVCLKLKIPPEGTHAFRWNFAQRRLFEYAKAGYTNPEALQAISFEMKHNRASITEHYLGGST